MAKLTHFHPDALVIFVKGFRTEEIPKDEDILTVSSLSDIKELMSVNVSLTVKNSPGTFTVSFSDTGNRFIVPDEPETEISNLYERAQGKLKTIPATGSVSDSAGTYYEFARFMGSQEDLKTWVSFEHGTLEDIETKQRYVIYYNRNIAGKVTERYALDSFGNIIFVVREGDTAAEATFLAATTGTTMTLKTSDPQRKERTFILYKHKNEEFVTKYKDENEQGYQVNVLERGRCRISPMDRVVIFMSRRFTDDGVVIEGPKHKMVRVFTGLVNSVQQGYAENQHTLTVTGEDVTKFMKISVINVNPSLINDDLRSFVTNPLQSPTFLTNIFKTKRAPEIIELLTLGGAVKGTSNVLNGIGSYTLAPREGAGDYEYDPVADTFIESELSPTEKKKKQRVRQGTVSAQIKDLFKASSVHIIDPFKPGTGLKALRAYEIDLQKTWQLYGGDFKDRRELAYQIAQDMNFEFFADRNGHIWFRPPRFSNAHILGAKIPEVYIMDNASILSFGFIESDQELYTGALVSTEPVYKTEALERLGKYRQTFTDDISILKFGMRFIQVHNPLINTDDKAIRLYAKSLLQRLLAGKYQGQITITGRPELEVGQPVFIPIRNMIYYVESIDHALTFGGRFETTLHLAYGRKPWDHLPELLTYAANDDVYSTDGHIKAPVRINKGKVGDPSALKINPKAKVTYELNTVGNAPIETKYWITTENRLTTDYHTVMQDLQTTTTRDSTR